MVFRPILLVCVTVLFLTGCGGDNNGKTDPQAELCLVSEIPDFYFDSGSFAINYNDSNRVSTITQSSFNIFSFTYDASGKITRFSVGVSQVENLGAEIHTIAYDDSGRMASIKCVDAGQTVTATPSYDEQNRIVKVVVTDPRGVRNYTKRMEYDAAGNVTKVYFQESNKEEKLLDEYKYDTQKSPYVGQPAFQLIPLISSLSDKSHFFSANNPVQYKGAGYGYTAVYQYSQDMPTEISLLLQRTGNPGVTNKQKLFRYLCK